MTLLDESTDDTIVQYISPHLSHMYLV
jgi:hypothetical protein